MDFYEKQKVNKLIHQHRMDPVTSLNPYFYWYVTHASSGF